MRGRGGTVPFELGPGALADVLGPVTTIGLFGAVLLVGSVTLLAAGSPFELLGNTHRSAVTAN